MPIETYHHGVKLNIDHDSMVDRVRKQVEHYNNPNTLDDKTVQEKDEDMREYTGQQILSEQANQYRFFTPTPQSSDKDVPEMYRLHKDQTDLLASIHVQVDRLGEAASRIGGPFSIGVDTEDDDVDGPPANTHVGQAYKIIEELRELNQRLTDIANALDGWV